MTDPELLHVLELIAALIMAVLALWSKRQAEIATNQTQAVITFFDPANDSIPTPPPSIVPGRTWKMGESTKAWICRGKTAQEKASLLQQIDEAERKNLVNYTIGSPTTYYHISYGLVEEGGISG